MFKLFKFIIISLCILGISYFDVNAEEILTWQDCVKEARQRHPDLISAAEELKQAQADKSITTSAILPQITSGVTGSKSKSATQKKQVNTYAYSVTGQQLLFDGFKTSNDINSASQTVKASQYNYAVTSSNVLLDLKTAFVKLLKAQELVSITELIAARRRQNLELVRLRYEAGREHKGSLLTAQADLAQAEFEVKQAKRDISLAQRRLITELGRDKFSPISVEGSLEILDFDETRPDFGYLTDNIPFLQELIAKKEAARFDLKSAKANFFPKVYLNTSTGNTESHWPPTKNQWSLGLSLSFPLFEGGSRIAEVSKAKSKFRQAQADERSGRDSVIFTLEETWVGLQDAKDNVSVQDKYLAANEERAKIANAQYSTGLVSFDDWIIIEDNLVSVRKSFLNAKADLLIAEANWIQAKGGLLDYED